MEEEKETAEENLRMLLAMVRDTGTKDSHSLNGIVARNVLHEELGFFADRAAVGRMTRSMDYCGAGFAAAWLAVVGGGGAPTDWLASSTDNNTAVLS
jgi:hypothetical protein